MKILNKEEFYELPAGILYSDYKPCCFYDIKVKSDTILEYGKPIDFNCEFMVGNIEAKSTSNLFLQLDNALIKGDSLQLDFNCSIRDASYKQEQYFAVYEQKDIDGFIDKLKTCKGL